MQELRPELLQELALNCALNSKAHLIEAAPDLVTFIGNRTECALLMLARKWGFNYTQVRPAATNCLLLHTHQHRCTGLSVLS